MSARKRPRPGVEIRGECRDCVIEFELQDWLEFHTLMAEPRYNNFVWRGQRRDDLLFPSLERNRGPRSLSGWLSLHSQQLTRFKKAVAGRRGPSPANLDGEKGTPEQNDEWWALGQHHGLHTPLLDWTESPYFALFFAFAEDTTEIVRQEKERGESHFRYVYGLNRRALESKYRSLLEKCAEDVENNPEPLPPHDPTKPAEVRGALWLQEGATKRRLRPPWIRFINPMTDENTRLLSQGGLFTQAPPGRDIEGFVRERYERHQMPIILTRTKIPDEGRWDCLESLHNMAIHNRNIFPDIDGACAHANIVIDAPDEFDRIKERLAASPEPQKEEFSN